jgi:hypothetical protein
MISLDINNGMVVESFQTLLILITWTARMGDKNTSQLNTKKKLERLDFIIDDNQEHKDIDKNKVITLPDPQ